MDITGTKDIEIETGVTLRENTISDYSEGVNVRFLEIGARYQGKELCKLKVIDTQMVFYFRKTRLLMEG